VSISPEPKRLKPAQGSYGYDIVRLWFNIARHRAGTFTGEEQTGSLLTQALSNQIMLNPVKEDEEEEEEKEQEQEQEDEYGKYKCYICLTKSLIILLL